jgi:hypothetical protein
MGPSERKFPSNQRRFQPLLKVALKRRIPMPNQNQNPGQQSQNPSHKPGQQQGGGQKPGQQQQDPSRQGQNPNQNPNQQNKGGGR